MELLAAGDELEVELVVLAHHPSELLRKRVHLLHGLVVRVYRTCFLHKVVLQKKIPIEIR